MHQHLHVKLAQQSRNESLHGRESDTRTCTQHMQHHEGKPHHQGSLSLPLLVHLSYQSLSQKSHSSPLTTWTDLKYTPPVPFSTHPAGVALLRTFSLWYFVRMTRMDETQHSARPQTRTNSDYGRVRYAILYPKDELNKTPHACTHVHKRCSLLRKSWNSWIHHAQWVHAAYNFRN